MDTNICYLYSYTGTWVILKFSLKNFKIVNFSKRTLYETGDRAGDGWLKLMGTTCRVWQKSQKVEGTVKTEFLHF